MEFPGFPAPAAYAAYTGRSYSNFPGFGLAGGIAGYPTGTAYFPTNFIFYKYAHA